MSHREILSCHITILKPVFLEKAQSYIFQLHVFNISQRENQPIHVKYLNTCTRKADRSGRQGGRGVRGWWEVNLLCQISLALWTMRSTGSGADLGMPASPSSWEGSGNLHNQEHQREL